MARAAANPAPSIELGEFEINGTARLLATVLGEKVEEAAWKGHTLQKVARGRVCVHTTDRDEKAFIAPASSGGIVVGAVAVRKPRVTVSLGSKMIPKVLRLKQGPLKLPVLWDAPGRVITGALIKRTIVVHGIVRHPVLAIRVLQLLSVPQK